MKNLINDYFYFTKRERNGLILLVGLALLFLATPAIFRKFRTVEKYEFQELEQLMAATFDPENIKEVLPEEEGITTSLNPQPMDPNLADKQAFLNLGLSPKLVNTILNYRNKGGKFYTAESLKKIYGMTESDYKKIEPYIVLTPVSKKEYKTKVKAVVVSQSAAVTKPVIIQVPTEKFDPNTILKIELLSFGLPEKIIDRMIKFRSKGGKFFEPEDIGMVYGMKEEWVDKLLPWIEIKKQEKVAPEKINISKKIFKKKENPITDINQANFEDWQKISGIGSYYADKIMGYREKLGGFISVEQILETNGLPDSIKQAILPSLRPSDIFRKLKINTASTKEMAIHPYITWKEANAIYNYRKQHGPFESRADLEKMLALKPAFIDRIIPYLDFTKLEK